MRLIAVEKVLAKIEKHRLEHVSDALDKGDAANASFEYGQKVGYNQGLKAAIQQLNALLKEEDDVRRSEKPGSSPGVGAGPGRAYG